MKKIFFLAISLLIFVAGNCLAQTASDKVPLGLSRESVNFDFENSSPENRPKPSYVLPDDLPKVIIQKSAITSQDGNKINIALDIKNGDQFQSGIKYSVELSQTSKEGQFYLDKKVYDEKIDLPANSTVSKEFTYQAPDYLSGDYDLWVKVSTENSNILGLARVGSVKLTSTRTDYVEIIPGSCYLAVEGDNSGTKYHLDQGVDVAASENLIATCKVKNHYTKALNLTPNFETYYRTILGDLISKDKAAVLNLKSDEEKEITLTIPKAKNPQAYDAALNFIDDSGSVVSNREIFHYVLQGKGATIQDFTFDKDYYSKGDTAQFALYYTLSADNFPNSRSRGTKIDKVSLEITMKDGSGISCADPFKKDVNGENIVQNLKLEIPVTKNCPDPNISLAIKDSNGQVLASENYNVKSANAAQVSEESKVAKNSKSTMLLAVLLLTLVVILAVIVWHKRKVNNFTSQIIFIAAFLLGSFISVRTVNAQYVPYPSPPLPNPCTNDGTWITCNPFSTPGLWCYDSVNDPGKTNWHYAWPSSYGSRIPSKYLSGGIFGIEGWVNLASFCTNGVWQDTGIRQFGDTGPGDEDWLAYARYNPYTLVYEKKDYDFKAYQVPTVSYDTTDTINVEAITPKHYVDTFKSPWTCPYNENWTSSVEGVEVYMTYTVCASRAANFCSGQRVWNECLNAYEDAYIAGATGTKNCTPSVSLWSDPVANVSSNPLTYNSTTTLGWSSSNASRCQLWDDGYHEFNTPVAANTTQYQTTKQLTAYEGYHVTCYNDSPGGTSAQADLPVYVGTCNLTDTYTCPPSYSSLSGCTCGSNVVTTKYLCQQKNNCTGAVTTVDRDTCRNNSVTCQTDISTPCPCDSKEWTEKAPN